MGCAASKAGTNDEQGRPPILEVFPVDGSAAWVRPPMYEVADGRWRAADDGTVPAAAAEQRSYDVAGIAASLEAADAAAAARLGGGGAPARRRQRRTSDPRRSRPAHPVEEGSELAQLQRAIESGAFTDEQRRRFRELVFGEPGV